MKFVSLLSTLILLVIVNVKAATRYYDDYDDHSYGGHESGAYGDDSMYQEYADRQHKKLEAGNTDVGSTIVKVVAGGIAGWFIGGKVQGNKVRSFLNKRHKKEQKELYTQYYNDIYTLQKQNEELAGLLQSRRR